MEKASQILCQSCLEKLSEAMEVKCEEGKEPEPVDLVLIDFETMELYCVQEQYTKRSIRDYTLWMAHTGGYAGDQCSLYTGFAQRQEKMRV